MTRQQLNNALAQVLVPEVEIVEHLQTYQMILDYLDQEVSGVTTLLSGTTDLSNYYTKTQVNTIAAGKSGTGHTHSISAAILFIMDGGGSTITTGYKGDIEIPFNCTIDSVRMFADQTGSTVVDVWKDTFSNYPPTSGDSITASAKPTISSGIKSEDTTLTGWTTSISAGDILRFNVVSVSSIQRLTISIKIIRVT